MSFSVPFISLFLVFILAFGYGSKLVRDGTLDPNESVIVIVLISAIQLAGSIGSVGCLGSCIFEHQPTIQMLPLVDKVREAQSVAVDVFEVIDRIPLIDPFCEAGLVSMYFV
jgi:hypothetical protein